MSDYGNYYEMMQISPNAELQTIQRVYRMLAGRFHPDNPETGDIDRFLELQKAYQVLTDPALREAYDARVQSEQAQPLPVFETKEFVVGIDVEMNRRLGILCLLYNVRKASPDAASLSLLDFEAKMGIPREHLEFTIWYLREKGYVGRDERTSNFSITSDGVDFVEARTATDGIAKKLLKAGGSSPSRPQGETVET